MTLSSQTILKNIIVLICYASILGNVLADTFESLVTSVILLERTGLLLQTWEMVFTKIVLLTFSFTFFCIDYYYSATIKGFRLLNVPYYFVILLLMATIFKSLKIDNADELPDLSVIDFSFLFFMILNLMWSVFRMYELRTQNKSEDFLHYDTVKIWTIVLIIFFLLARVLFNRISYLIDMLITLFLISWSIKIYYQITKDRKLFDE